MQFKQSHLHIVLATLLIITAGVLAYSSRSMWHGREALSAAVIAKENVTRAPLIDPFNGMQIEARAAYVWDPTTNTVLFQKNADESLPLASLTKIMTTLVAKDNLVDSVSIRIDPEYLKEDGDNGLLANEYWQSDDLLEFSLITSSNDGMKAIASYAGQKYAVSNPDVATQLFVRDMNKKATSLGLISLTFLTATGLDINDEKDASAFGSASDIAKLFMRAIRLYPNILEATKYGLAHFSSSVAEHNATNTDEIVDEIPGLIASKTGYTDVSGGNLIIAMNVNLNHPVIAVVLGSGFDTRFTDMKKLIQATRSYYLSQ